MLFAGRDKRHREAFVELVRNLVLYTLLMTLAFHNLAFRHAILVAVAVACLWSTQSQIHHAMSENAARLSLQHWHSELVMRLAMSESSSPVNWEEWRELSRRAKEDINGQFEQEKLEEQLSGGPFVAMAVGGAMYFVMLGGLLVLSYFLAKAL